MLRRTTKTFVISSLLLPAAALCSDAQTPSPDTLRALSTVAAALRDSGRVWGEAVWPGFRPDTIPLLFIVPGWGSSVMNFPGALPPGFTPLANIPHAGFQSDVDRGAASTSTELAGRRVAQLSSRSLDRLDLIGLAMHEAFHVYERSVARNDRRFGGGEASGLVSRYPAFDAENEAGMALEGRVLHSALTAPTTTRARALAFQYVAARERRNRTLDPDFTEFEKMAELNEGLAEYALVRARGFEGEPFAANRTIQRLDSLTTTASSSMRLRFYSTGSGLALLLDRLAGRGWKQRLVDEDLTLFELLARVSGFRDAEGAAIARAAARFDLGALRASSRQAVAALRMARTRQLDSLLALPGVRVELDGSALPGHFIGFCGYDPQNMLQAGDGVVLHTRWLHICGGDAFDGEFTTPVVQRAGNSALEAVVGPDSALTLTIRGSRLMLDALTTMAGAEDVRLESPGLTLRIARADLARAGRVLRITLHPR